MVPVMSRFIIGGPGFLTREVDAATLSLARRQAIILAFKVGCLEPHELRKCWAEPANEGAETYWRRVFRTPSAATRQAIAEEAGIKISMRHTRPW